MIVKKLIKELIIYFQTEKCISSKEAGDKVLSWFKQNKRSPDDNILVTDDFVRNLETYFSVFVCLHPTTDEISILASPLDDDTSDPVINTMFDDLTSTFMNSYPNMNKVPTSTDQTICDKPEILLPSTSKDRSLPSTSKDRSSSSKSNTGGNKKKRSLSKDITTFAPSNKKTTPTLVCPPTSQLSDTDSEDDYTMPNKKSKTVHLSTSNDKLLPDLKPISDSDSDDNYRLLHTYMPEDSTTPSLKELDSFVKSTLKKANKGLNAKNKAIRLCEKAANDYDKAVKSLEESYSALQNMLTKHIICTENTCTHHSFVELNTMVKKNKKIFSKTNK